MRTAEIIAFPLRSEPDTWDANADPEIARLDTSLEVVSAILSLLVGLVIGSAAALLWGMVL